MEKRRVFTILDGRSISTTFWLQLENLGCETYQVYRLEHMKTFREIVEFGPEIVIIDGIWAQGISFCKFLKSDPATQHIEIIFAYIQQEAGSLALEAGKAGASGFVTWDVDLEDQIDRILKGKQTTS